MAELIFCGIRNETNRKRVYPRGVKITFVHRKKTTVGVYYGQNLTAECRDWQEALEAVVSADTGKGNQKRCF